MPLSLNQLRELLDEESYQAGVAMFGRGEWREEMASAERAVYMVGHTPLHRVGLSARQNPSCSCTESLMRGVCRHMVTALLAAQRSGALEHLLRTRAANAAPELLSVMESALPQDGTLNLEVTLLEERQLSGFPNLRIGLRIGEGRLYAVKSIPAFLEAMDAGTPMSFGKGFEYRPEWMRFSPETLTLLGILRALCQAQKAVGATIKTADQRLLPLPPAYAGMVLRALGTMPFVLEQNGHRHQVRRVMQGRLQLGFRLTGDYRGVTVTGILPRDIEPLTPDCAYAALGATVVEVPQEQRAIFRVLWKNQADGRSGFVYTMRETPRVIGDLLPYLRLCGMVEMDGSLLGMLEKQPLKASVYLDRDGDDVVARTRFCYGERDIDPFDEVPLPETLGRGEKLLLRDAAGERQVLDVLGSYGFHVGRGRVYLSGQEAVYSFLCDGVQHLQERCEVFLSRDFRKLKPRKPLLKGSMRLNRGRVELMFTDNGVPAEEIMGIMEALSRHRRYFRLKDGSFLDLSDMDEWQSVADTVVEAGAAEGKPVPEEGMIALGGYRMYYLTSLLDSISVPVEIGGDVRGAVEALLNPDEGDMTLPQGLSLRPYQQRGFRWLRTLDQLHMGGVLADDMGLGKTVQVIALLKAGREAGRTALVVSPTSLTYNWLSEIERFAPEMSVMVLSGTGAQRASQIEHVKKAGDVDVLITSYPLIRRDIELMRDIRFRYVILDEAQQIKNAGSVGALAVKQLQADARFALTGTPMENSIGELWSIFDFVLPGYLGSYASFLRRYQDAGELDDLRRRVRPFLMRRLKKDVLTELPDKIEQVLTAQMTQEQQKVYQAVMERLRPRVDRVMSEKGLGRGRTEVLACMTELRQVCCHPSLVLEDYGGSSGKMELLMDLLPGALASGRRVLLFSQFTSMLKILLRHLEASGITCMYLDGETPSGSRLEMTERFNAGHGQVFLISLKAGGTGLNLTGADLVIHYDPWWNPAAEDQATDRAHRIGQTRKVEVWRLVTHDSIEEQVVALGQRKKALFDQLITPGEELVTALTEADIRALFA